MRTSDAGIEAIKSHEGLRLHAYPDPGSGGAPWTIGYGSTLGVTRGQTITEAEAEQRLRDDLRWAEAAVTSNVRVPLNQAQFDALVSFVFNVGASAFARSTLLRKLNSGDYDGAANEFLRWDKAGDRVLPGLTKRRAAEKAMFLSEVLPTPAPAPESPVMADPGPAEPIPAPAPEPAKPRRSRMAPFLAAALPSLIELIPKLGKIFGSGSEVSERNVKAAEIVAEAVKQATGAKTEQEAVQIMQADPAAVAVATKAVEAIWFELVESGGNGIAGARKAADAYAQPDGPKFWLNPAFWISLILLILPVMLLVDVFFIHPENYAGELRTQIVTGVLMTIGMVGGFWLGTSFSSQRKTDLIARQ